MTDGHHIALVGLMGSGKTTVGRLVADRLRLEFRDNDVALTEQVGVSAAEFAARHGMAALHDAELEALLRLLGAPSPSVIAVAASSIDAPAGRDALSRHSFVAWLDADVSVLADRASRGGHRPLKQNVVAQLHAQAGRRSALFRAISDITVDVATHDAQSAAACIVDAVRSTRPSADTSGA